MSVLSRVDAPSDLRALSKEELLQLCTELRAFTVDAVQKTGGHMSSSLGTVELTVALHRVVESPRARLVWDTGHQAYIHKILTGRRSRFDTLRQFGGMSGFLARSARRPLLTGLEWIAAPQAAAGYAHDLYANLRRLDQAGCDAILVEAPPRDPAWFAIEDRLTRAAAGSPPA